MTDCIFLLCNGIQVYLVNLDDVAIEVLNKTKSTNTGRYGYLKYPYEDSKLQGRTLTQGGGGGGFSNILSPTMTVGIVPWNVKVDVYDPPPAQISEYTLITCL